MEYIVLFVPALLILTFLSPATSYEHTSHRGLLSARSDSGSRLGGKCNDNRYRKKKKNRWHSCGANSACDKSRGCPCVDGYWASSGNGLYPTCTAHRNCSGSTFPYGGTDLEDVTCVAYRSTELSQNSRCNSVHENDVLGVVSTTISTGKAECEALCLAELSEQGSNHAFCCFYNAYNGVCKKFDGFYEASSLVYDGVVSRYAAAVYEAEFQPVSCTRSGDLSAARRYTCSGEPELVATIDLPGIEDRAEEYALCEEACYRYVRVSSSLGSGCCRMNHFTGNCNFYAGGNVQSSTSANMSAVMFQCTSGV